MMASLSPYLPYFFAGAALGILIGTTAGLSFLLGRRRGIDEAHKRYEASKIADRAKYVDSIHACREENRRLFEADRNAYRKIDYTDGPGCMGVTAQFGNN